MQDTRWGHSSHAHSSSSCSLYLGPLVFPPARAYRSSTRTRPPHPQADIAHHYSPEAKFRPAVLAAGYPRAFAVLRERQVVKLTKSEAMH